MAQAAKKREERLLRKIEGLEKKVKELRKKEAAHRRIEEALKKSDEKLRLITENTSDYIAMTTLGGIFTYASPSYKQLGYEPYDLLRRSGFDFIHPDDKKLFVDLTKKYTKSYIEGLFSKGKNNIVEHIEFKFANKWGGWHDMESTVNVARDLHGKGLNVVFVSRDVTKRKQVERALQDAYFELKETQRQLVQSDKLAAVGQLAGGIAHEVKNPLGTILLCVNDLETNPGIEKRTGILKIMKKSVMRADRLVKNLLTFSKPAPLELKACRINEVLKSALELIEKQLEVKNITVNRHFGSRLPLVLLDQNQMEQVFLNVLLNSLQVMSKGGMVDITTYVKDLDEVSYGVGRRASDLFRVGEKALVAEIKDNGPGIPKHIMNKIFDPFFSTRPPWEGTGLGLTITRAIVERHRGIIQIESEEGRGARVTIMMPILKGE